jgi:phosphoglycolate phosphatase-like HAD superfamily hydrolase
LKAIIFDFDGVILDSAGIKTEAYREMFSDRPEYVDEIVAYHMLNMGVSRFKKFRYFYERILQEPYDKDVEKKLGDRYTDMVLDQVLNAPYIKGAREFLESVYGKYLLFIATGTPTEEILYILEQRDLSRFFHEAIGSPQTKTKIITDVLNRHELKTEDAIMFGDALTDYDAAKACSIGFIGIGDFPFPNGTKSYADFSEVERNEVF